MAQDQTLIKLIWDFRGPDAEHIAKHHHIHLKEFISKETKSVLADGFEILSTMHCIAFIVVEKNDMIYFRDTLKPHRGAYVEH